MDQSTTEEISPLLSSAGLFLETRSTSPIETGVTSIEDSLPPQETLSHISDPSTSPTPVQDAQLRELLQDAEHQIRVCSVSFK